MADIETVDGHKEIMNPIYGAQKANVARMRAALLACSLDNFASCRNAINNITVMRIYHQVARIIRYLELMDKLDDKLYDSIEHTIDHADPASPTAWMVLLRIQEQLQDNMIKSQKLLEPYLNSDAFNIVETIPQGAQSQTAEILDPSSRERLMNAAQTVLHAIEAGEFK